MCSRILLVIWLISNLDLNCSALDETTQDLLISTKINGKINPRSLEIFPTYSAHHSNIPSKHQNPKDEELEDLFFKDFHSEDYFISPLAENNMSTEELFPKNLEGPRKKNMEHVMNIDERFDTPVIPRDSRLVTDGKSTRTTHKVHQTTKRSSENTITDISKDHNLTAIPLIPETRLIKNNSKDLNVQAASDSNPMSERVAISERESTDIFEHKLEGGERSPSLESEFDEITMDSRTPTLEALNFVTEISVQETINGKIVQRKPSREELRSLEKEVSELSNINEQRDKEDGIFNDHNNYQGTLDDTYEYQNNNKDQIRFGNIPDETSSNDIIDDLSSFLKVDLNFTGDGMDKITPSDEEIKDLDMILRPYEEEYAYSNRKKDRPSTDDTYISSNYTFTESTNDKSSTSNIMNKEEDVEESLRLTDSSNSEDKEDPQDYRNVFISEHKNSSNVRDIKITFSETEGDFLEDDDDDFSSSISEISEMDSKGPEDINQTNSQISNLDEKQMNNPLIATNMEYMNNISESSEVTKSGEDGEDIEENGRYLNIEKTLILNDIVTPMTEKVIHENFFKMNSELGHNEDRNSSIVIEKPSDDVDHFPTTEYTLTIEDRSNVTGKGQYLTRGSVDTDAIINLRQNMSSENNKVNFTVVSSSESDDSKNISSNTTKIKSIFNETVHNSRDSEIATGGGKEYERITSHSPHASINEQATSQTNVVLEVFTTNSPDTTTDVNLYNEFEALPTEFPEIFLALDLTTERQDEFDSFMISFSDLDTVTDGEFDSFTSYLPPRSFTFGESGEEIDDIEHNFNLIKQVLSQNKDSTVERLDETSEGPANKTVKNLKNIVENITRTPVFIQEQSSSDDTIRNLTSAYSGTSPLTSITKLVPSVTSSVTIDKTSIKPFTANLENLDITTELMKNDQKETNYLIVTNSQDTIISTVEIGLNITDSPTTSENGIEHTTTSENITTQRRNNNTNFIENEEMGVNMDDSSNGSSEELDLVPHELSPGEVESLYNSKIEEYESMEEELDIPLDKPLDEGDAWTLFGHKPVDYHRPMSGEADKEHTTDNYVAILKESEDNERSKNFEDSDSYAAVDENEREVYLVPILRANILNNTAEFSVKISRQDETFFVPSLAYIQGKRDIVNITWRANEIFNNSIALRIFDKEEFFMIKEIFISLFIDDEVIYQRKVVALNPDPVLDDSVSGKNRVVMMRDGTYIFFSNVDFLKKDVYPLEDSDASMRARRLWHIEIVSICLAVIVVIAIVLYVVAMKTRRKLSLGEKNELNQVTHC